MSDKKNKKVRNRVSYNCGLYSYPKQKWEIVQPVLHYSYHPSKKHVLSIIIAEKDPKRAEKLSLPKTCPVMGLASNMDCYICGDEEIKGKITILIGFC